MNTDFVLTYLEEQEGVTLPRTPYRRIAEWREWWEGTSPAFHRYEELSADGGHRKRTLYRLGMAKKVASDWAAALVNDRTCLSSDDERINRVLFGAGDGTGGLMTTRAFWSQMNAACEFAFALGTCAAVMTLKEPTLDGEGNVLSARGFAYRLFPADCVFPLSAEDGEITGCCFAGEYLREGKPCTCLSLHTGEGEGRWRVRNVFFDEKFLPVPPPGGIPGELYTGEKLFAVLTPNSLPADPELRTLGLGAAVYADALDNLKAVDLAFNNFARDLFLGGKKVFLNQSLIAEDAYGNRVAPDDVAQQLFVTVGDGDLSSQTMLYEHNPALRTGENTEAVQAQLDYLSMKCGFGCRHYRFKADDVTTATEYAGERQDMLQQAERHNIHVEQFLKGVTAGALWFAVLNRLLPRRALDARITVDFDGSAFINPGEERERALREVSAGLMAPWEYRVKFFGDSPETAKRRAAEMRAASASRTVRPQNSANAVNERR